MPKDLRIDLYRIQGGKKVELRKWDPDDTPGFGGKKKEAKDEYEQLRKKLDRLQEMLYAEHKHKVLIVLQAMDTGGKDSTIRAVFEGVNPQGVRVSSFKRPTQEELDHDFLWRIHKQVPGNGEIVIFNRSHYESILLEKVHKLAPEREEGERYGEINDFERMLHNEGTRILKFYLHIGENEQKKRLLDRLNDPSKEWKFSANDLPERQYWSEYMKAYEKVLEKTSTEWAPWYLVPSNHKWFRDLFVVSVIVQTMEGFNMKYPKLSPDERKSSQIK